MTPPLVLKFGGDALATPERIAAAAHRIVRRRAERSVVAVASARRGVTDHLLGLVEQVREASGAAANGRTDAAADRVVTSGEVVAASLLAVALGELGVPAATLDAREAGLRADGHARGLAALRPARLQRLLDRGVVPVVTGFQGWYRGRVAALGRGGSDLTAVVLAGALGAAECELVKDPGALHTADPKLVPEARPIRRAHHGFVADLAHAGARVIRQEAAALAERAAIPLRFTSLHTDGEPATRVIGGDVGRIAALVLASGDISDEGVHSDDAGLATVTAVFGAEDHEAGELFSGAGHASAVGLLRTTHRRGAVGFLVPAAEGPSLQRHLHAMLLASADRADTTPCAAYA
jgi:aspartate kinase